MCQSPILRNLEPFPQTTTRSRQRSAFINSTCCQFLRSPGVRQTGAGTATLSALPPRRLDSCAGSARSTEPLSMMPTRDDTSPLRRPLSPQRTLTPACAWDPQLSGFPRRFPRILLRRPRLTQANHFNHSLSALPFRFVASTQTD